MVLCASLCHFCGLQGLQGLMETVQGVLLAYCQHVPTAHAQHMRKVHLSVQLSAAVSTFLHACQGLTQDLFSTNRCRWTLGRGTQ